MYVEAHEMGSNFKLSVCFKTSQDKIETTTAVNQNREL